MDRDTLTGLIERWMGAMASAYTVAVVAICDHLGVFAAMAGEGPLGADDVAERIAADPRMMAEALATLATAGWIEHEHGRFWLSEEQAAILADERGPYFLASHAQLLRLAMQAFEPLTEAFVTGDGIAREAYGPDIVANSDRLNGPSLRIVLTRRWLPAVPGLVPRLEAGIEVADVGCGTGAATTAMARAFPASTFVGYDIDSAALEIARMSGEDLDNLRFEQASATQLPARTFDFVLAFDVIHDLGEAPAALASIRASLREGGMMLMVEPNVDDGIDRNRNPVGNLFFGISTLYCLPSSMAHGDAALGAAWGPTRARELAQAAGFEQFERLPIENPFQAFYLLS